MPKRSVVRRMDASPSSSTASSSIFIPSLTQSQPFNGQYLPLNGSTSMLGNLDMGGFSITNVARVDGMDISQDLLRRNGSLAMLGDLNMGGHSIANVDLVDGVDIGQVGLDITTLKSRTVLGGDGLQSDNKTFGEGSPTLSVRPGHGIEIVSDLVRVDEDAEFYWIGEHRFHEQIGSSAFSSGWAGAGWRIDPSSDSGAYLELDSLFVRGAFTANELILNKIRATNGDVYVADGGKVAEVFGSGPYTIYAEDYHGFAVGDLIRAQQFTGTGIYQSNMQVTAVASTTEYSATLSSGSPPEPGYEYVRIGNVSDATRQGALFLSSSGTYSPFMDITDGVNSWAAWASASKLKARLGRLDGVTDAILGSLDGYGLYSENAYLRGVMVAGGGDFIANEYGAVIQAGLASTTDYEEFTDKLTFAVDPLNVNRAGTVGQIYGQRYTNSSDTWNSLSTKVLAGSLYGGATVAQAFMDVQHWTALGDQTAAYVNVIAKEDITSISIGGTGAQNDLNIIANTKARHILPLVDSQYNLGSDSQRWATIYADAIVAGASYTTDSGHVHDQYIDNTELTSILAGYAPWPHTHDGYATSASLSSHTNNVAIHRSINDLGTGGTDLWSASKINAAILASVDDYTPLTNFNAHANSTSIHTPLDDAATSTNRVLSASKIIELLDALDDSLRGDLLDTDYIDAAIAAHAEIANAHHNMVTVGPNLVLTGQHVALDDNVALKNIDNEFAVSQSITGDLSVTQDLLVGRDVVADRYGKFTDGVLIGGSGDPTALLDVRGLTQTELLDADLIETRSLTVTGPMVYKTISEVIKGGSERWTPGGAMRLATDLTLTADLPGFDVNIEDGQGHFAQAVVGDILEITGIFQPGTASTSEGTIPHLARLRTYRLRAISPWQTESSTLLVRVLSVQDEGAYFSYSVTPLSGEVVRAGTFPKGSGVAGYGSPTEAVPLSYMRLVTNDTFKSPYLAGYTYDDNPRDAVPGIWYGNAGILPYGNNNEMLIGAGPGLQNWDDAYFWASNERVKLNNVDLSLTDTLGNALSIDPATGIQFNVGGLSARTLTWVSENGIRMATIGVGINVSDDWMAVDAVDSALVIDAPYRNGTETIAIPVVDPDTGEHYVDFYTMERGSDIKLTARNEIGGESAALYLQSQSDNTGRAYLSASNIVLFGAQGRIEISNTGITINAQTKLTGKLSIPEVTSSVHIGTDDVVFSNLATSDPGISGKLYISGGTLKVSGYS